MVKKIIIFLIVTMLLFFSCTMNANAFSDFSTSFENEKVCIWDNASLLSDSEEMQLKKLSHKGAEEKNIDIIFVTADDTGGLTTKEYVTSFYNEHDFKKNGVMFVIDTYNNNAFIYPFGTLIPTFTEEKISDILDDNFIYSTNGDYYDCFINIYNDSDMLLGANETEYYLSSNLAPDVNDFVIAIVVTCIVLVFLIASHNRANKNTKAQKYMSSNLNIISKKDTFIGDRDEVQKNYYNNSTHNHKKSDLNNVAGDIIDIIGKK